MNLAWAANNWGKLGMAAMKGSFGKTIQGASIGAAAGAGWGMLSSDTSVLGGALMGAGLGAAGMRYGNPFYRKGARGFLAQGRSDYRRLMGIAGMAPTRTTLASNTAVQGRSRVIKRGAHPVAHKVPPGIRRLRRQVIPGVGGDTGLYAGSRRNIIKSRDARVFGV